MTNAIAIMPTQMALTVSFFSFFPKKNMIAAPKAGSSGIIQMLFKKNIAFSTQHLAFSSSAIVYLHLAEC